MKLDIRIEHAMGMDEEKWLRHANPWSVWTRLATLPAFALAAYSREWIGWWCLLPIGLIAIFLWLNTRIFPPAVFLGRWETRAILGEQRWLARRTTPIPDHHRRALRLIVAGSSLALVPMIVGLVWLAPWLTTFGTASAFFGQLWFLDRLARLHDDMGRPDRQTSA